MDHSWIDLMEIKISRGKGIQTEMTGRQKLALRTETRTKVTILSISTIDPCHVIQGVCLSYLVDIFHNSLTQGQNKTFKVIHHKIK